MTFRDNFHLFLNLSFEQYLDQIYPGASKFKLIKSKPKLDWSITSKKGETRFEHVNKHSDNNLSKKDHGVFYGDPITVTNIAWAKKGKTL